MYRNTGEAWNNLEYNEPLLTFDECHFESPLNKSNKAKHNEEDIPEPNDKVDFIDDDIESKDAKSIASILPSPRSILIVRTTGNLKQKETSKWEMSLNWLKIIQTISGKFLF